MNPLTRPIAEETFERTPNSPMPRALASAISLSKDIPTPDGSQPNIIVVNPALFADAFQPDISVANNSMSNAADDRATTEPLMCTPHSEEPIKRAQSLTIHSSLASVPAARPQVPQTDNSSRIRSPSMLHGTIASPTASSQDPPVQLSSNSATAATLHSSGVSPIAPGSKSPPTVAPDQFQRRVSRSNLLHGSSVLIIDPAQFTA